MRQSNEQTAAPVSKAAMTVLRVRDYIENHFARRQGYETYRKLTGLSTSHLCQSFRSMVGRPPLAYLIDLRLQHAVRLLRESDLSIKEVSNAVGFGDANYFSRLFRKRFKRSPRSFKPA
jgi:AraC-like DNA-binding protein